MEKEKKAGKKAEKAVSAAAKKVAVKKVKTKVSKKAAASGKISEAPQKPQKTQPATAEKPLQEPKGNLEKIKYIREASKKRNFQQTFDLIINLKNIDLKKPENRFTIDLKLPEGRGKQPRIAFITEAFAKQAKDLVGAVITKADIAKLAKDKKAAKRLASETDFFLADTALMAEVGKSLGSVLAPRGKMPRPVPQNINIEPLIQTVQNSLRVSLKNTPVIQVPAGTESMKDEAVLRNMDATLAAVVEKLPKGKANLRSVYLKLTMGPPVKMEVA